ncbi:CoA transferase [Nocardioides ochotonae]|uniref:CoA transferase n=1 Tax=Nocardioides ochotonae TaxID=2685869 RepID=UPI0014085705|nr:CoA transferase [Nocardioides ochotonae]
MDEPALWAASGAMALTGRPDGPPVVTPGRPASAVAAALARIRAVHPDANLPDVRVLGERAAAAGLARRAPTSCGGAFRTTPTYDGVLGLSLPRGSDLALLPALVEGSVDPEHPWPAVAAWAAARTSAEVEARVRLLGLPGQVRSAGEHPAGRAGVLRSPGVSRPVPPRPLVVDLSSLWAGPLCAHLLGRCGADVVKVESRDRPDGARSGPAGFYDLLHAGHRAISVDFGDEAELGVMRDLVARADLVIESSRPRALARLGLDAEALVAAGVSWLSITARGRASDAVGFGDDVAFGAGLHTPEHWPVGDALADPLTGVSAAAAAVELLAGRTSALLDVSMHHVAQEAAAGPGVPHVVERHRDGWLVVTDSGVHPVAAAYCRPATGRAPAAGSSNESFGLR